MTDYKDPFKSLQKSVRNYTMGAFEVYDKEDVEGLLKNRLEAARERLGRAIVKTPTGIRPSGLVLVGVLGKFL